MIYAHSTVVRDPALVRIVEQNTGHRAVVVGSVVKLVPTARQQARILLATFSQPTPPGAA